ncbi:MAG TPA: hypothetical protein VFM10_01425 [Terriglobales bacterium]|nr:hypothetical protein [Terriglobales bacterium]
MNLAATNLERARRLLAELKALYDDLPQECRATICDQLVYCAQNCVPASGEAYV